MHGVLDVAAIQIRLHGEVDDGLHGRRRRFLAFFSRHSLLEQLHIHLKADACDMPMLLRTEKASRAADLEITHRDLKARAKTCKLLHRLQALLRRFAEHLIAPIREVGKRHLRRAADASAHLIELREPKAVGIVDDDCIRVGDINAVLDDARRKQDVIMSLVKVHHDLLQNILAHLSVRGGNTCLRYNLQQVLAHPVDALHAVIDKVDLPAARQFTLDRAAHHGITALHDVGLHGETLGGRRLDDAHITCTCERHVQCTRNRRRGERQYIDARRELLDLFLLRHAKTLLLIHDEQAQLLKAHALSIENRMRPDENVHLTTRHIAQRRRLFPQRAEAADDVHLRSKVGKASRKGLIVLLCENCCRHEHGDLIAVHRRLVRRANRNLRLAEAHITAEQAIHRLFALHIVLDLGNSAQLIVRLLIRKCLLELALSRIIRRKGMSLRHAPRSVELNQMVGDILDGFLRLGLCACPVRRPHAMQARRSAFCPDILL